jgi:SAM-dependent methyltransferase
VIEWAGPVHTARYHDVLLRAVPRPCGRALDIGCGTGAFSRTLSQLADHVDAIDRDPDVIERAREASTGIGKLRFACADFMSYVSDESAGYDFICALASLHHLPLPGALNLMKSLLRPGGVLGVIGLYREHGIADFARSLAAFPVSLCLRLAHPRMDEGVPLRNPDLTLREIRTLAEMLLPGAVIKRRLLWRYTLVYHAP